ncbi:MAG TPA: type II toxin-antitoxin system PemK/MazF family toxin [Limnochordales bacterium]|nr:type II toxin-antitoxin system PemK/MazF family toxin [Limnochordales bacterium]
MAKRRGDQGKGAICRRGDIFYANLNPVIGSEQGGVRPVLILQNDAGNRYSPTTIVAAITSRTGKPRLPTHLELPAARYALDRDSVALLEQIRTIDKRRLKNRIGRLDADGLVRLERALAASLGLDSRRGRGQ